jgi:DNA invertase Pin-like site-specific DNA recombinase
MAMLSSLPVPRNGHTFVVGIVARISGCRNQKELSLEDQVDHAKEVVADVLGDDAEVDYRIIQTKGKGERLDRPELDQLKALIRTRALDLLVAEDIGRMVRGAEATKLCGIAVDHGTRVIAPNDGIDTADTAWEERSLSACGDHVGHNAHTSMRLKQKLMNRFVKFGGATPQPIYGYRKPDGARTYRDWEKEPEAAEVYAEWFRMLRTSHNYSAVADWLNARGVPVGPYARRSTWDGAMVRRITRNPMLKGMPGRGFKHTVKHNESGRRLAVTNPAGPKFKEFPHLAHVDADTFDEVNALMAEATAGLGRKKVNGQDPLLGVPRKRTRFPGQHARCWYCGRPYVWGGNGLAHNLMCNGSRSWCCWNSFGFSGELAARRLVERITAELAVLDGFDAQFQALVERAAQQGDSGLDREWAELQRREATLKREQENLLNAIMTFGPNVMIQQKLRELEAAGPELARHRRSLERRRGRAPDLPASTAELRSRLEAKFRSLAIDSPEFGDAMRPVVPEFHVYLVRLLDGGHPLPRAVARVVLTGDEPDARLVPGVEELFTRTVTIDLFDPPQREQIRPEAVRLHRQGMTQREIAKALGVTQPAVSKALALDGLMRERGLDEPYERLTGPPADYVKLRRSKNAKYRFEALEGYTPPAL